MELLAPAGNKENFLVALEAGADAVYLGAPRLNARNLSRDLSLGEIGAMVRFAHQRGRKVYIAINSLVRETDLSLVLQTLGQLEAIGPDALIVQDLGLIRLARRFFPSLRLHGSTLMTTHNHQGVSLLAGLGCARAVLARELTLEEIAQLADRQALEIEVFVHGAMCFSYSGLCLFSSYFGGKSGLRGNCVQPCRRKFSVVGGKGATGSSGGRGGYFFSMNDLEGLALVPELKRIGVDSLKIEGRLRSATYVNRIVTAYRMVIDAPAEQAGEVIKAAAELIPEALGRRTSPGFFLSRRPKDAVIPHHSGNIGGYLGRITTRRKQDGALFGQLILKQDCAVGERLRLHGDQSGERAGFTLERIMAGAASLPRAQAGQRVELLLPEAVAGQRGSGALDVYRVDVKETPNDPLRAAAAHLQSVALTAEQSRRLKTRIAQISSQISGGDEQGGRQPAVERGRGQGKRKPQAELWLRTDNPQLVFDRLPFHPDRWVLNLNRQTRSFTGRLKGARRGATRDIVWALPTIVPPAGVPALQRDIKLLISSGFRTFQLGQLSQHLLFSGQKVTLFGDYTLNLLNSQAVEQAFGLGLQGVQLCIEADRDCLSQVVSGVRNRPQIKGKAAERQGQLGLTVYGAPPLFTARLTADHFVYGRPLASPKQELFVMEKKDGLTLTRPQRPFSLLPFRSELDQIGFNYLVIDLSGQKAGRKDLQELGRRLDGKEKVGNLPTFNYRGVLE